MFGSLAASITGGADFEQWPRLHGRDFGLPDTLPALEHAWLQQPQSAA